MIAWRDQLPDFQRRSIEELLSRIPFTVACVVMLGSYGSPRVLLSRQAREMIWSHLGEQRIEMGGLLIGKVYEIDDVTFIVSVENIARGDQFDGTRASLRLESAVWENARRKVTDDQSVVGWYHSHPNLGAFFSSTDRHTQASFFNQAHSLGLVVDPVRLEERWFIGGESQGMSPDQIMQLD